MLKALRWTALPLALLVAAGAYGQRLDPPPPPVFTSGSWTPALTFGGGATTCATCIGSYEKIGNLVAFEFVVTLSSVGAGSGAAVVNGLPFASQNSQAQGFMGCGFYQNTAGLTAGLVGFVSANATTIQLTTPAANAAAIVANTNFTATSQINCAGVYKTP